MSTSLDNYQASKDSFLARVVQTLSEDERFAAAWLTGSYARGDADALSDFDLTLVAVHAHSAGLCRRLEQVSAQTSPERLALFSQFGTPAVVHENNNNAPAGGTFTFVLYAQSAIMVDWTLIPQGQAVRPPHARSLFEKASLPAAPPAEPESLEARVKRASEMTAFFWMMLAVTAKYLVRQDQVFVTHWLEALHGDLREVERLLAGRPWEYTRGSLSAFEPALEGQRRALLALGERMEQALPRLAGLGGQVLPSPMAEIKRLLQCADPDK